MTSQAKLTVEQVENIRVGMKAMGWDSSDAICDLALSALSSQPVAGEAVAWYVQDYGIYWREGMQPACIRFPSTFEPSK